MDVKINQGRKANNSNSRTNSRSYQHKTYGEKPAKTPKAMNKSEARVNHVASYKEDDLTSQPDEATVYVKYINRDRNSFDSYFIPTPMFKLVADVVGDDMVEKIVKARKDKLDALQLAKSQSNFTKPSPNTNTSTPTTKRKQYPNRNANLATNVTKDTEEDEEDKEYDYGTDIEEVFGESNHFINHVVRADLTCYANYSHMETPTMIFDSGAIPPSLEMVG